MNDTELLQKLSAPFPANDIEWRIQQLDKTKLKASVLAYITARGVINRFNDVCGLGGWDEADPKYVEVADSKGKIETGFIRGLKVLTEKGWVTRYDGAPCTDIEPLKGGMSDSLKRVAVHFGVGVYLYDLKNNKVTLIEGWGNGDNEHNVIIEGKWFHWKEPELPAWALPKSELSQDTIEYYAAEIKKYNPLDSQTSRIDQARNEVELKALLLEVKTAFERKQNAKNPDNMTDEQLTTNIEKSWKALDYNFVHKKNSLKEKTGVETLEDITDRQVKADYLKHLIDVFNKKKGENK